MHIIMKFGDEEYTLDVNTKELTFQAPCNSTLSNKFIKDSQNLLELLDKTLEQQESYKSCRISNDMDFEASPILSSNREHITKMKQKFNNSKYHKSNEHDNMDNVRFLTNKSQIDSDEKKRKKSLKKQREESIRVDSGQSIVSFINEKVKEFENEPAEYEYNKKRKYHSEHHKKRKHLEQDQHNSLFLGDNINDMLDKFLTESSKLNSQKKLKKLPPQNVSDTVYSKSRHSFMEGNESETTPQKTKKKKKGELTQETDNEDKPNTKDNQKRSHKKHHQDTDDSYFSRNESETPSKIKVRDKVKEKHKGLHQNDVDKTYQLSHDIFDTQELLNNVTYKTPKKDKGKRDRQKSPMYNDMLSESISEPLKKSKKKTEKGKVSGIDDIDPMQGETKKRCVGTPEMSTPSVKNIKQKHHKQVDNTDDATFKTPKKDKRQFSQNYVMCNDSQDQNNIIQSSVPESNYITFRKSKKKSEKEKISDVDEMDPNLVDFILDKTESSYLKPPGELQDYPTNMQLHDIIVHPSKNIVVNSEDAELMVSAVGVSILSHENDQGIMESNTSQVFGTLYPNMVSTQLVYNNIPPNTNGTASSSSGDSTQSKKPSKLVTLTDDASNIKKDKKRKNKGANNETFNTSDESTSKNHKQKNDIGTKHTSRIEDTSTDESSDFEEDGNNRPVKIINIQSLDRGDVDAVKEALDASLMNKDFRVSDDDIWTLENLFILIPWDIPLAHRIETRMSSTPTKHQQAEFKNRRIHLKLGPYTSQEDDIIKANWIEFCQVHNLQPNPIPFLNFKVANKTILFKQERIKFVQYLGRGLDNRMLYSIYKRFCKMFNPVNKGKYLQEEDEIIMTYTQNCQTLNRFAELATLLNRDRNSVIKRYHTLTAQQDQKWKLSLYRKLIQQLIVTTGVESVADLEHIELSNDDWEAVVKNLTLNTSPSKVKRKWMNYVHPRLFNHKDKKLPKIKRKLVTILYDDDETDLKAINWNHMAQDFDGFTGEKLHQIFSDMLIQHVPTELHRDLKGAVSYLRNECSHIYKERLDQLVYEDGDLYIR